MGVFVGLVGDSSPRFLPAPARESRVTYGLNIVRASRRNCLLQAHCQSADDCRIEHLEVNLPHNSDALNVKSQSMKFIVSNHRVTSSNSCVKFLVKLMKQKKHRNLTERE